MAGLTLLTGWLRKHVWAGIASAGLLAFGTVSLTSLLIQSRLEIVYAGRMSMSFCGKSGLCVGRVQLSIGNTGRAGQNKVVATIPLDPAKWAASHEVLDLAGDQPRSADPEVRPSASDGRHVYEIDRLAPGTELKLTFDCTMCSIEDLKYAKTAPIEIRASGTVLQGDPRVATLGRRLSLLLWFL